MGDVYSWVIEFKYTPEKERGNFCEEKDQYVVDAPTAADALVLFKVNVVDQDMYQPMWSRFSSFGPKIVSMRLNRQAGESDARIQYAGERHG
jgi:hypothetical protein